jgi:hypothetical protein
MAPRRLEFLIKAAAEVLKALIERAGLEANLLLQIHPLLLKGAEGTTSECPHGAS